MTQPRQGNFVIFLGVFLGYFQAPDKFELRKKNTDKHEGSFLDLNIKTDDGKFDFGLFVERDYLSLFSIARIPDKPSNVTFSIIYCVIGAESLRIARASSNPESFSTAPKGSRGYQRVSIGKISGSILNCFNVNIVSNFNNFNNISQSNQELRNLIS